MEMNLERTDTAIFEQYFSQNAFDYSVVIEEDNLTVYAYLLKGEEIIADVWLCNTSFTPTDVEWKKKNPMPFRNSKRYYKESQIMVDINSIVVKWGFDNKQVKAVIYQDKKVFAILKEYSKPGFSINAAKNGPLALATHDF